MRVCYWGTPWSPRPLLNPEGTLPRASVCHGVRAVRAGAPPDRPAETSQALAGPEDVDDAHGLRLVVDEEGQHALVVLAEERMAQRRLIPPFRDGVPRGLQELEETFEQGPLRISSGSPFSSYSARPWKPSKR